MILHPPFLISPSLKPALRIGDAWLELTYARREGREGRTRYAWSVLLPDGAEEAGDDLQSGCGGGNLQEGFGSLLSFLGACAEAIDYQERTGRESDNADLFPPRVAAWAADVGTDAFSMLALEIEETLRVHGQATRRTARRH